MANFIGKYELVSSDKFDEYMEAIGVGFATRVIATKLKPSTTISQVGDEFHIKTSSTFKNTEIKFELGKEFKEETADGRSCTSVITLETDNKLKHTQTANGADLVSYREISGDEMTLTLHAPNVECKRIYKKVN